MITIKYDCPESNTEMAKTECGFYCRSCNREVFDFTNKSVEEIAEINANNPSISCGVFTTEQAVVSSRSRVHNVFRMAFAAIFVLGLNVTMLFGQEVNSSVGVSISQTENSQDGIYISGTLKSEKGRELYGWITCEFGQEVISLDTDAEGRFNIVLPAAAIGQRVKLSFGARGFHLKELVLEAHSPQCYSYEVELKKYKKQKMRRHAVMYGVYR